jgi:hypothetical protein
MVSLLLASSCGPASNQQDPVQTVLSNQDAHNRAAMAEISALSNRCKADCFAYAADQKNLLHFKSCSDFFRASQQGMEDTVARSQCGDDVWHAQESCRDYDKALADFKSLSEMEEETDKSLLQQ